MLTTGAMTNSPVGSYVITNTMGSLVATNYMVSLGNGSLTVTERYCGDGEQREPCVRATNPVLTVSYSGFVNGEDQRAVRCADVDDERGDEQSGGRLRDHEHDRELGGDELYGQLGNGTLTVTGAVLTATANNVSRAYGATNPVLTVSYSGFVNGEGTNVLPVRRR